MTRFDRRALFASGAAAALLAATGVSAQAQPQRGGRLRAALSADPGEAWTSDAPSLFLSVARHGVLEGLTEVAADGTLRGRLASDWQSSDGGRSWTFTLRDALWHDGTPVVAAQVARALGGTADGNAVTLTQLAPDTTLPLRMAQPDALISHPDNETLGTGLFRLATYEPGRRAILERVAPHPKDNAAGWADTVDLTGMASADTRLEALMHDMVDVIDHPENPTPAGLTRLAEALAGPRAFAPAEIGSAAPLDNLRLAERWWLA
ncbi:MAG: ABC transporter substrate-binding protein [Pseudomonadota bacterium]